MLKVLKDINIPIFILSVVLTAYVSNVNNNQKNKINKTPYILKKFDIDLPKNELNKLLNKEKYFIKKRSDE